MALFKSHTSKRGGGFPDVSIPAYYVIGTYTHDRLNDSVQVEVLAWADKAARDDFKTQVATLKDRAEAVEAAQAAHAAVAGQEPEDQARRTAAYATLLQAQAAFQTTQKDLQDAGPEPTLQARVQISRVSRFADGQGQFGTPQVYEAIKSLPEWRDAEDV